MSTYLCGVDRCPSDVTEFLERVGGKNPHGAPLWRLVVASTVFWKTEGGKIWDKSLTVAERGGFDMERGIAHENRPLRDEHGKLTEKRRYPHLEGWILQRWFPPSKYDKAFWFAPQNCLPDGTPKLGEFPERGDYEMIAGPVDHLPAKEAMREYISVYWRNMEEMAVNPQQRLIEMLNADMYTEREEIRKSREFVDALRRDRCSYLTSTTLTAGALRTKEGERLGIREHIGN